MHVSPHSTTRLLPGWRPQVMGCCMTQSRKPLALGALHELLVLCMIPLVYLRLKDRSWQA